MKFGFLFFLLPGFADLRMWRTLQGAAFRSVCDFWIGVETLLLHLEP